MNLPATLDAKVAYSNADYVIIAIPTNYDSTTQKFDTRAVNAVIKLVMKYNTNAIKEEKEIDDRFYRDLEFDTGGLRGVMGAGTISRATKGLGDYLLATYGVDACAECGVVNRYDIQNNSSFFE